MGVRRLLVSRPGAAAACWLGMTLLLRAVPVTAQGYHRDVFLDGGVSLGYRPIEAIETLGLTAEYLDTDDAIDQNELLVGADYDENGVLLYPDGEPRFRLLYSFGGSSTYHGVSLGQEGIERAREFYHRGGSYAGSCAGCALFSSGRDGEDYGVYYRLWPGRIHQVDTDQIRVGHLVPPDSRLLAYRDFGTDLRIADVLFWGGNYPVENPGLPAGTEVLLRYDAPDYGMHGHPSCWAYKASPESGRGVVTGSHPELCDSPESLAMTEAIFLYALDGVGDVTVKGQLERGVPRVMDRGTSERDPAHARIGDGQYHHFRIRVPEGSPRLAVTLTGQPGYPFRLYLSRERLAYQGHADYAQTAAEPEPSLAVEAPTAGEWFVGVECAATVRTAQLSEAPSYSGDLTPLNGVSYTVVADWDEPGRPVDTATLLPNCPNPFSQGTKVGFCLPEAGQASVRVYDAAGQEVARLFDAVAVAGPHEVWWEPESLGSGAYFIRLQAGSAIRWRRCLRLR